MANPVDEFLMAKEALGPFGPYAQQLGRRAIESGATGLAYAGMGVGVAGAAAAAQRLYNAATKKRDFDNMMEANPHLMHYHEREPEAFGRMFTSLRNMNPEFSRDPMVAGAYMFQAMESPVEDRGSVAVKARGEANKGPRPGPISAAFMGGFQSGAGKAVPMRGRPQSAPETTHEFSGTQEP